MGNAPSLVQPALAKLSVLGLKSRPPPGTEDFCTTVFTVKLTCGVRRRCWNLQECLGSEADGDTVGLGRPKNTGLLQVSCSRPGAVGL